MTAPLERSSKCLLIIAYVKYVKYVRASLVALQLGRPPTRAEVVQDDALTLLRSTLVASRPAPMVTYSTRPSVPMRPISQSVYARAFRRSWLLSCPMSFHHLERSRPPNVLSRSGAPDAQRATREFVCSHVTYLDHTDPSSALEC